MGADVEVVRDEEGLVASRPRTLQLSGVLTRAGLLLAVAYLVALAAQSSQLVASVYRDADAASAPVIGQLFGASPHSHVLLGQMAWFSTLIFELATRSLPLHRQIWEVAPYAMALASAALVAWGSWRVAGRWAAAISGTLMICAAPHTLRLLFSLDDHSPTWFSIALLGAVAVLYQRRGSDGLRSPALLAIALLTGAIVGVNAASDPLLVLGGIVPVLLAVAGTAALRRNPDTAGAAALMAGTVVIAIAAYVLTDVIMHGQHVTAAYGGLHLGLASAGAVSGNLTLWWQSIAVLGNGDFFGQTFGLASGLQVVCALLAIGAVALTPWIAWRILREGPERGGVGRPPARGGELTIVWSLYWALSATLISLAFVCSSSVVDIESDRYLVGVIYAAAALVPLLARGSTPRRAAIAAATVVFALAGFAQLLGRNAIAESAELPSYRMATEVERIARNDHLAVGYAGYWDAAPITWASHMRVKVYPVEDCSAGLCRFGLHQISGWYRPRPGESSFLLADPSQSVAANPPPGLGAPSAVLHVGPAKMYVYPYDIASHIHR